MTNPQPQDPTVSDEVRGVVIGCSVTSRSLYEAV